MDRWIVWGCVLSLLLTSCTAAPTQLVVVVDTDIPIPAEVDRVRVTAGDGAARMASEEQELTTAGVLPLTVSVVPDDGFLGPVEVVAEGFLGETLVVSRRARVMLVANESRLLRLDLVASCVGLTCAADESCGPNGCGPIDVPSLPEWTGVATRLGEDAGLPDGGLADAGTPDAGPPIGCMDATDCDDGVACTTAQCQEGFCVFLPDDSACDDGNECTDDRCGATGCLNEANEQPCDDGVFCNGFDQCAGGSCSMHGGDPCAAPTVCDESGTRCTGCTSVSDCPAGTMGTWSACSYGDSCTESGTRMRTIRSYDCVDNSCVPTDTPETEPCSRSTSGNTCGVGSCGSYGSCGYTDSCDESATRSRTCVDLACAGGVCASSNRTETTPCSRSTTGDMCGMTTCGGYGSCNYSGPCDESASQSRTCMDFACASGSCQATPRTDTRSCSRNTDGDMCGSETCGMYGSCNYSGTCDESAVRSRTCTTPECSSGTCSGSSMRTDTDSCSRSTDGTSCGMTQVCMGGSCVSCTPTLSGSFGGMSGAMTEVSGSGNRLTFTNNTPASGDITASAGVTFSGSALAMSCLWQVTTMGSTLTFTDFAGANVGSVTVSGASVSGSAAPPCIPSMFGCFPPCINQVTGGPGRLTFHYTDGSSAPITFGCP